MNNVSIKNNGQCTGCGLCASICPKNAIELKEDDSRHHFLYPKINKNFCSNCGLCLSYCPSQKQNSNKLLNKAYVFNLDNELDLLKSSSGGFFQSISKAIILRNGVVYGCIFDKNLKARHCRIETIEELNATFKSKYVQSFVSKDIYKNVMLDVSAGKLVLFSGTPCQCAAISLLFSGKIPNNLILVDLICKGVPSQWLFDINIRAFEKLNKCVVNDFDFRFGRSSKTSNKFLSIKYSKHNRNYQIKCMYKFFPYCSKFDEGTVYRESCYECNFLGNNRFSDFTIGDFWGLNKVDKNYSNHYHKSLVIINTDKGVDLIKLFNINLVAEPYESSIAANSGYSSSCLIKDYSYLKKCENALFILDELRKKLKQTTRLNFKSKVKIIVKKIYKSKNLSENAYEKNKI